MKYGFVYCWENIENGKKYIGSHFGNINDGYIGSGVYFKRAYIKNPNQFNRTILYVGSDYREIEKELLTKYNAQYNKEFYNLKNESIGGWSHLTKESKQIAIQNMAKAKKGKYPYWFKRDMSGDKNPMYGRKQSVDAKNKISKKHIGKSNADKKVIELTENKLFDSVTECAKYFGVTQPTMSILIRNQKINRGNCKGKIFNYA